MAADVSVFETVPDLPGRGKDVVIEGSASPGIMKAWVFEAIKRTVHRFNTKKNPADKENFLYEGLYHPPLRDVLFGNGKVILKGVRINLDEDYFQEAGEDYSDLQDVGLFHEAMEFYYVFKPGKNLFILPEFKSTGSANRDNFAHFLAMIEEYRYANSIGKAERFKEFYQKKVEAYSKTNGLVGRANICALK